MGENEQTSHTQLLPFDHHSDVYPYYIVFEKNGIKVNVPISLPIDASIAAQKDVSFIDQLSSKLQSKFPASDISFHNFDNLDKNITYTVCTDDKPGVTFKKNETSGKTFFVEIDSLINELRRLRLLYALTNDAIVGSIKRVYGRSLSRNYLTQFELRNLTLPSTMFVKRLVERWVTDMNSLEGRERLFSSEELKRLRLERQKHNDYTSFNKKNSLRYKELCAFYRQDPKPTRTTCQTIAEKLGLTMDQVSNWFVHRRKRAGCPGIYAVSWKPGTDEEVEEKVEEEEAEIHI